MSVIMPSLKVTRKIVVTNTTTAQLLDTRAGYVNSTYSLKARSNTMATPWCSRDSVDKTRRQNDRGALVSRSRRL